MVVNWLRHNRIASFILTFLRLYVGCMWLKAGWQKAGSRGFDASGFLKDAITNPVKGPDGGVIYDLYVHFLKYVALPHVHILNTLIPTGECLVGLGLILGCFTTTAMFFGLLMNFSYLFAGAISSNPMDILAGVIILFAGFNAGIIGLDRWIVPFIRELIPRSNKTMAMIELDHNKTLKINS